MVPRAEVGGTVGVHDLGQARVLAAEWSLTPADIEALTSAAEGAGTHDLWLFVE